MFYPFQHGADSAYLIITSSYGGVDQLLSQWFTIPANILKTFQIIPSGKAHDFARRVVIQVPEIGFKTVGVEAKGKLPTDLLVYVETILLGLLAPDGSIFTGFFGFDNS